MGSDVEIADSVFENNRTSGPQDKQSGGGAIACQNAALSISGTRIANNGTAERAGGGVLVSAVSEGALAGVPDLWHAILIEVFDFTELVATIDRATTVIKNTAGLGKFVKRKEDDHDHAKGGGLYVLRGDFRNAPELKITIEQYGTSVRENHARAGIFKSDLTGDSIQTDQIDLVDCYAAIDDGDGQIGAHMVLNTYRYES